MLASSILSNLHISALQYENISVVKVKNAKNGIGIAEKILAEITDRQTALFLSGGKTPKELYEKMANSIEQSTNITIGAAAVIDERFGAQMHENSNEKMFKDSGLLNYFERNNIPFYGVLQNEGSRQDTAMQYDETLRFLLQNFPKSVGILGVGLDGHTAGIPANYSRLNLDARFNLNKFVVDYDDQERFYKERITMTFSALSMLDVFIVLVFGKDKKKALDAMFSKGSEEEIPARFYLRPDIAQKTVLITDQKL